MNLILLCFLISLPSLQDGELNPGVLGQPTPHANADTDSVELVNTRTLNPTPATNADEKPPLNTREILKTPPSEDIGPSDIIVILDSTSSMASMHQSTIKYLLARWVLSDILDVVPEGVNLGVLELRDAVSEFRKLEPLSADDLPRIRRAMWSLRPAGHGELRQALQRAGTLLKRKKCVRPVVVLITDGEDCNCGEAHGAAAELREAAGEDIEFLVVAPCQWGPITQQLQSLAEAGRGSFTLAHNRDSLNQINRICEAKRTAEVDALDSMFKASQRENEGLVVARVALQKQNQQLQTDGKNTSAEKDRLAALASKLEEQIVEQDRKLNAAKLEVATLRRLESESNRVREAAEQRLSDLKEVNVRLVSEKGVLNNESTELTAKNGFLKTRIGELQKTVEKKSDVGNITTFPGVVEFFITCGLPPVFATVLAIFLIYLHQKKTAPTSLSQLSSQIERLSGKFSTNTESAKRELADRKLDKAISNAVSGLSQELDGIKQGQSQIQGLNSLKAELTSTVGTLKESISRATSEHKSVVTSGLDSLKKTVADGFTEQKCEVVTLIDRSTVGFATKVQTTQTALSGELQQVAQSAEGAASKRAGCVDAKLSALTREVDSILREVQGNGRLTRDTSQAAHNSLTDMRERLGKLCEWGQEIRSGDSKGQLTLLDLLGRQFTSLERAISNTRNDVQTTEQTVVSNSNKNCNKILSSVAEHDQNLIRSIISVKSVIKEQSDDLARKIASLNCDFDLWKAEAQRNAHQIQSDLASFTRLLKEAHESCVNSSNKIQASLVAIRQDVLSKICELGSGIANLERDQSQLIVIMNRAEAMLADLTTAHHTDFAEIQRLVENLNYERQIEHETIQRDLDSLENLLESLVLCDQSDDDVAEALRNQILEARTRMAETAERLRSAELAASVANERIQGVLRELRTTSSGPDTIIGPTITPTTTSPVGGGPSGPASSSGGSGGAAGPAASSTGTGGSPAGGSPAGGSPAGGNSDDMSEGASTDPHLQTENNPTEPNSSKGKEYFAELSVDDREKLIQFAERLKDDPNAVAEANSSKSLWNLMDIAIDCLCVSNKLPPLGTGVRVMAQLAGEALAPLNAAFQKFWAIDQEQPKRKSGDNDESRFSSREASSSKSTEKGDFGRRVDDDQSSDSEADKKVEDYLDVRKTRTESKSKSSEKPQKSENLTKVQGLGKETQTVLNEAGIKSFEQLANSSVDRLKEILELSGNSRLRGDYVDTWPKQARMAADGDWEGLAAFKEELSR